ncbi:MAG TPA: hypothetical protein VF750_01715, partial [Sphingomicrobium sp.]
MLRTLLTTAAAAGAFVLASPAFAQAHGHGSAGAPPAAATTNSQGPANASSTGISNASPNSVLSTTPQSTTTTTSPSTTTTTGTSYNPNSPAAQNSQGPANASPTGISHANDNSVLARGAVSASTLQGLNTGMTVTNSSGTAIGTVTRVITGPNDTIRG